MPILTVDNISKNYGERNILDKVNFSVNAGDKIAFIGNNGAGKSTLFKIIKGTERADDGKIILHGNTIVGFLSQNMDEQDLSGSTLKPQKLIDLEINKTRLENEIAANHENEVVLANLMNEYSKVTAAFEAAGGYDFDHRMAEALAGLGLGELALGVRDDFTTLSGGEKMRVCLAQLIVSRPDILMLDEPTNHLDMEAIEWLEGYLSSYGGAIFVISHDRHFIDAVANRVIELEDGRIAEYKGNYADFKVQKAEFLKTQVAVVANLEKELEHQLDVKQTMLSHRNISGYHQREKMADKLADVLAREKAKLPSGHNSMSFTVVPEPKDGASDKIMLAVRDVSKKFDDDPFIFEHVSFELKMGEKIFLCGPNGCGKSTLLTMLLGLQGGFDGSVFIAANATCGFMEQFVPFADESISCLDEIIARSDMTWTEARSMLARFGFRGEDALKTINVLSGGERSRLYLCCLLQEKPDILFLDEPTNHLDIESREILEDALTEYTGSIVCVSHDRFFIEKCAHKVLGFLGGTTELYDTYKYYRNAARNYVPAPVVKEEEPKPVKEEVKAAPAPKAPQVNKLKERQEAAKRRERIRTLEKLIPEMEEAQKVLESKFTEGAGAKDYELYAENSAKIEEMYEEYALLCDQEENQ
ncbi:MAG: ABC-F family ATP-binding cassette domain-containing protein [Saccharofermentans sp.]|nr:ABC-F family ATP-binding cassette domain-containing protein [Saccharofermentans sp.]